MIRPERRWCWILPVVLGAFGCADRPLETVPLRGATLATMRPVQQIEALTEPELIAAPDLHRPLPPDTPILGFVAGDRSVAIALRTLHDHEIVNLRFGPEAGASYAATW